MRYKSQVVHHIFSFSCWLEYTDTKFSNNFFTVHRIVNRPNSVVIERNDEHWQWFAFFDNLWNNLLRLYRIKVVYPGYHAYWYTWIIFRPIFMRLNFTIILLTYLSNVQNFHFLFQYHYDYKNLFILNQLTHQLHFESNLSRYIFI